MLRHGLDLRVALRWRVRLGMWRRLLRPHLRVADWECQWAVFREWSDGGHDYFGLTPDIGLALLRAERSSRYWRASPVGVVHRTVEISRRDFDLHRRRELGRMRCLSPDCPRPRPALTVERVWP